MQKSDPLSDRPSASASFFCSFFLNFPFSPHKATERIASSQRHVKPIIAATTSEYRDSTRKIILEFFSAATVTAAEISVSGARPGHTHELSLRFPQWHERKAQPNKQQTFS